MSFKRWKTVVVSTFAAAAATSIAEGAPTAGLPLPSPANDIVVRIHRTHTSCLNGFYQKDGEGKEGWHRHRRGETYRCTPQQSDDTYGGPSGRPRWSGDTYEGPSRGPGARGQQSDRTPSYRPPTFGGNESAQTRTGATAFRKAKRSRNSLPAHSRARYLLRRPWRQY